MSDDQQGSGGGWMWSWLGGLFSQCSVTSGAGSNLGLVTIEEGQRLTNTTDASGSGEGRTPIVSLAALERGRAKMYRWDDQSQLNAETEQIQQILTIVERLRREPSPLAENHLITELQQIFRILLASDVPNQEADRLLCATIVRNVLTWARRHLAAQEARAREASMPLREGDGLDGLILALATALNQSEKTELRGILGGLPSSVLGDEDAQEETRVFLDIKRDIREAQKLEGSKVERRQQLVEVATGVVVELIQSLSPTIVVDQVLKGKEKDEVDIAQGSAARVVASLLNSVAESDRLRLVMEQLILASSDWLPKDHERRDERLDSVFHLQKLTTEWEEDIQSPLKPPAAATTTAEAPPLLLP